MKIVNLQTGFEFFVVYLSLCFI